MGGQCCKSDTSTNDTELRKQKKPDKEELFFQKYPKIEAVSKKLHAHGQIPKNWSSINKRQQTIFKNHGVFLGKKDVKVRSGYGVMLYDCGLYYIGVWQDNKRHGFGYMIEPNGSYYKGEWRQDLPNGFGHYQDGKYNDVNGNNNIWAYRGKWKDGKKQQTGQQVFPDGTKFVGNFTNNLKNGKGRFFFNEKCYFQGFFVNDIAQCQRGVQKGLDYIYQGPFQNNDFHGAGRVTYFNPDQRKEQYVGQFDKGLKHGYGQYTWPNTSIYKGQWISGQIANKGVFVQSS